MVFEINKSPLGFIYYEAPHVEVMSYSIEGVLCGSRQIDDLEVLPELDW